MRAIPRSSESQVGVPRARADTPHVPSTLTLTAALIAALAGWGVIHHGKALMHNGIALEDGGGWTAIILTETVISLGAAAFAIS